MYDIRLTENTAVLRRIPVYLVDIDDGFTPETGVTSPTIEVSENGAAQVAGGGVFAEIGDGMYYYQTTAAEINTVGFLNVRIVKSGVTREFQAIVEVKDLFSTNNVAQIRHRLGLTGTKVAPGVTDIPSLPGALENGRSQAGAATTITLQFTGSSGLDDFYNGSIIQIIGGVGEGQARLITDYVGSTLVATVDSAWVTNPTNSSDYQILAFSPASGVADWTSGEKDQIRHRIGIDGAKTAPAAASIPSLPAIVEQGQAQAGAATTITLRSGASASNDFFNDLTVQIIDGTGIGQARLITDYVGSTKVATVDTAWITNPDSTSDYQLVPGLSAGGGGGPSAAVIADAVWDEADADHVGADTFGKLLNDVEDDTGVMRPDVAAILVDTADIQPRVVNIETDTNEIQGKLPANFIMGSSVTTDKDDEIDAILVDTNEMQGKLPTNNIMGSSVKTDKDDEIDAILVDTADMQPRIINIETDTNEIQGKLPTNFIMGSSVVSDKDDDIDAILVDTNEIQGKLPSGTISDFDETADPVELLDAGGAAGTSADELVDDIWDELLTGATHNISNSSGKILRELKEGFGLEPGTAQAGAATTITLEAGESSIDDFFNERQIGIASGTGVGQVRTIIDYVGATRVATVHRAWEITPDATSEYVVAFGAATVPASDSLNTIRDAILNDATTFAGADVGSILTDTNEIQGKLPDNNIMGSGVTTNKDDEIDAILADTADMQPRVVNIEVDTNEIQGKLPANFIMGSSVTTDKDDEIDSILVDTADMQPRVVNIETDTNEIQGKLPDNNIMGSGVTTNKDDEIDAILVDTSDMQPRVAAIEIDTNEIQGKLPDNNFMGSGVTTNKDDEIDAILVDTAAMQPTIATNLDATVSSRATPAQVNTEVDNALDTAVPVLPTADSINERIKQIDENPNTYKADVSSLATQASVDTIDGIVDTILVDTNETQTKLPTNNMMGSSVKTDKDDEIDSILVDTADIQPKIDVTLSTRSSHSADDVWTSATRTLTSFGTLIVDIWHHLLTAITTPLTIGRLLKDNVDATISSRSDFDEATDPVEILDTGGAAGTSASELVDDTWREPIADHDGIAGSTAEALQAADATADVSAIADAVWDELLSAHTTAGSASEFVTLIKKVLFNRFKHDGTVIRFFDDDNTLLLTGQVKNKDGVVIDSADFDLSTPAERSKLT